MFESEREADTLRLPIGPRAMGPSLWAWFVPAVLVAAAVAVAAGPWAPFDPWRRAGVVLALVSLAAWTYKLLSRRPGAGAWLVIDGEGVRRVEGENERTVVDFGEPLGATVLASSDHPIVLLCLTAPQTTRYFWAPIASELDIVAAPNLLAQALTAADGDIRADGSNVLTLADAEKLVLAIARRVPGALDRVYLSDSTGDAIVLDRAELRVGGRRIDLTTPLEWRAFIFQERGAVASSLSQAMWVRQADAEFVLVSPVTEGAWIRYAKASAGEPPPRELRRAVDRLFMVPLARALTRAGRASRSPPTPRPPIQKTPLA
jgi:hypothetical protein